MIYRPDPELLNAYADVLSRATRALAACKRAQEYLELADLDGLELTLIRTLELQRAHIKAIAEEEGSRPASAG